MLDDFTDVNVKIPLEDDYVQVEYISKNDLTIEYFMYPLNKARQNNDKMNDVHRDVKELDVIMIMIDSISRASAQRYMNETYKMLKDDVNSVILKVNQLTRYFLC